MHPRGHCKRTEKETLPFILGMSLLKRKGVRWLHPATEKRITKKELKMKVCQTHDEIFVSSFSVQHKNFVFGHLLKYTKTV